MQRRSLILSWAGAGLCGLAAGVHAQTGPALRVVASFSILADWVRSVGGPAVEVSCLVGPGADAHVFTPSPADAQRVAQADLVVVNGLRFEGWLERLVKAAGYRGPVLVASQGIKPRPAGSGADPHAWQSLPHAVQYVENIRAALVAARPLAAADINRRAAEYTARLQALQAEALARLGSIPDDRRRVITSHDAFGYFSQAYGVRFIAPRGWSTDSEPSAAAVAGIVRQVRETRASALLIENLSDVRLMERIASEAGVRVGGRLYSDTLSPPGTEADTYLRMFRHNLDTLLKALGAPATEGPANSPRKTPP